MAYFSDEEMDVSDSEMEEYRDKFYEELRNGKLRVKTADETFTCPYCPKKRKRDYLYQDLLQHASGVGNSVSEKRTAKEKANHLALVKYLANDLSGAGTSSKVAGDVDPLEENPEMLGYIEKAYEQLKNGNLEVKISDVVFTCPYCPKNKTRYYLYKDLLQHASALGKSTTEKRTDNGRANHLALIRYLENDLAPAESSTKPEYDETDALSSCSQQEKLVWPWTGVVVNIPTRRTSDGRFVGDSGSKFRDELIMRGFNPTRVHPLWNYRGHSGFAVVEFNKDWPGLHNAMSFEKAFEADRHGKKDWFGSSDGKSGVYCWVARADDYNVNNIIGEHLRKIGDLRTISEIMEEEARKQEKLVTNLTNVFQIRTKQEEEMKQKCSETMQSLNDLEQEKEKLLQAYNEDMSKIQVSAREHFQKILNDHEKQKSQLESQKKELEMRKAELEKREAQNESDRKRVSEEIEKFAVRNSSLQLASLEQQKADEDVVKLAKDQERQKEELHNRIMKLQQQLDAKQALELEIQGMRGSLDVIKHMENGGDAEVLRKMDEIITNLREKEAELEDVEALNQTLVVSERMSNDELQHARKEIINGLKELFNRADIGVKRMGELENKPFFEVMKKRYSEDEAEERSTELCCLWEEYLKDPDWHPFKVVEVDGKAERIINCEDEKLKGLKAEMGDDCYNAVTSALVEIAEYNPSGGYITSELWNFKEGRRASLGEGASFLVEKWLEVRRKCGRP